MGYCRHPDFLRPVRWIECSVLLEIFQHITMCPVTHRRLMSTHPCRNVRGQNCPHQEECADSFAIFPQLFSRHLISEGDSIMLNRYLSELSILCWYVHRSAAQNIRYELGTAAYIPSISPILTKTQVIQTFLSSGSMWNDPYTIFRCIAISLSAALSIFNVCIGVPRNPSSLATD